MANLYLFKLKSIQAIFAPLIEVGIPWADLVASIAYPSTKVESFEDIPWVFRIWTAFTGYLASPLWLTVFTFYIALTTSSAKKSLSAFNNFDDIEVLAALIKASLPRVSTLTLKFYEINLIDSLRARRYPDMTEVAWILFLMSSFPLLSNSAARITTEVVPSPTSRSWIWESSTRTFAAGCVTSNYLRIVAPSLVIVTSPISSTSILSSPWGPSEVLTIFESASTAIIFCVRTSCPCSL